MKVEYKPLTQQYRCCGPCAFQWILLRRGFWVDQEEIAWHCRLKVPKDRLNRFTRKMLVAEKKEDEGTITKDFHILLNKMLKEKNIALTVEFHPITTVDNPSELIDTNMQQGNDLMVAFSCKVFPEWNSILGHVCVIVGFDGKTLTLGDPSLVRPKFWDAPLDKIIGAMDKKFDGHERGFWVVKST